MRFVRRSLTYTNYPRESAMSEGKGKQLVELSIEAQELVQRFSQAGYRAEVNEWNGTIADGQKKYVCTVTSLTEMYTSLGLPKDSAEAAIWSQLELHAHRVK